MCAAVLLRDVVGVAEHALLVGVVPLQRHFHGDRAVLGAEPEHRLVDGSAGAVQILHERLQSAGMCKHIDRKSTRLNSSHSQISYAVFCLKKKKKIITR